MGWFPHPEREDGEKLKNFLTSRNGPPVERRLSNEKLLALKPN